MSAFFQCDWCRKTEPGRVAKDKNSPASAWTQPDGWFHRWDGAVRKDACCKECAEKLNPAPIEGPK